MNDKQQQQPEQPAAGVVVFLLDEQRYAVHLHAVERVLPMVAASPLPRAPAIVAGVINVHGRPVPVLDLRARFGRPTRDYGLEGELLIVRTPQRPVAFPVDAVVGVAELDAGATIPTTTLLPGVGYVSGIAPTGDGLLFIHDVDTFLSLEEEAQLQEAVTAVQG